MEHNQEKKKSLKIALVHDFLITRGGAERVLGVLAEMFPEAPIYTLLYDQEAMGEFLQGRDIRPSFLQKFPGWLKRRYRFLLPLYPVAAEAFDLRDFDLVISSSGAWSKGIVTRLNTKHIAYIHSPMRYVWDYNERYVRETGERLGLLKRAALSYLRVWDAQAAERPDVLVANSEYTRERIEKYYRREAEVVYPPLANFQFPISNFQIISNDQISNSKKTDTKDYFLLVSRLTKSKRVDLAVDTFNKLDLPLSVVGTGPEEKILRKRARDNIRFLGWQDDESLQRLYTEARALVYPCEEDFGLALLEAQAAGTPAIAYGKGGAAEIVMPGVTGELFEAQASETLADGVRRFLTHEKKYDREAIRGNAARFSREKFEEGIRRVMEKVITL